MFNIEALDQLPRMRLEETESSHSIGEAPVTYFDQNFSLLPSLNHHIQKKEVSVQLPVPQFNEKITISQSNSNNVLLTEQNQQSDIAVFNNNFDIMETQDGSGMRPIGKS